MATPADGETMPAPALEDRLEVLLTPSPAMASARETVRRVRAAALGGAPDAPPPALPVGEALRLARNRRRGRPTALLGSLVAVAASAGGLMSFEHSAGAAEAATASHRRLGTPIANDGAGRIEAAMALAPSPARADDAPSAAPPANLRDAAAAYAADAAMVRSGNPRGIRRMERLARRGYAPAQFHLATLYATGTGGVARNPEEARHWTKRAAEDGESKAMHNLALYYIDGTGGLTNPVAAGQWFRKAADLGVIDSQFNLGRLYERGLGVPRNDAEALKWYAIAARSGDTEAQAATARLKASLPVQAVVAATRSAAAFRALAQPTRDAPTDLSIAQRALSRLGYYQGPSDGAASPALRMALAAYQRDHGLPATGAPDPATTNALAAVAGG